MIATTTRLGLALALIAPAPAPKDPDRGKARPTADARESPVGASFKVPYRLTDTNHFLVRVRIDGKGPFNFLVDTGAPALYVGTEAAKTIGLEPQKERFWTKVDRLDIEGGATLTDLKCRVEDPFQLEGMNALGLPGARIDGILGFTILARFRLEIDPTKDRMIWTRLDHRPKEPFVPRREEDRTPPAEVQAMQSMGKIMKFMAPFLGKQPEEKLHPQGYLGVELAESGGAVLVAGVLPGSPAAEAGLKKGDRLTRVGSRDLTSLKAAHDAIADLRPGGEVRLVLKRGDESLEKTLTAAEGF